jgi:hypothetical protein
MDKEKINIDDIIQNLKKYIKLLEKNNFRSCLKFCIYRESCI